MSIFPDVADTGEGERKGSTPKGQKFCAPVLGHKVKSFMTVICTGWGAIDSVIDYGFTYGYGINRLVRVGFLSYRKLRSLYDKNRPGGCALALKGMMSLKGPRSARFTLQETLYSYKVRN